MKKALHLALIGAVLGGAAAQAQDFDDRIYFSPRIGGVLSADSRDADDALLLGVGFGRFLTPNWAIDLEFTNDDMDLNDFDKEWEHLGLGARGAGLPGSR